MRLPKIWANRQHPTSENDIPRSQRIGQSQDFILNCIAVITDIVFHRTNNNKYVNADSTHEEPLPLLPAAKKSLKMIAGDARTLFSGEQRGELLQSRVQGGVGERFLDRLA
ncbi:hypothetical protein Thiofri_00072 [Thiorhodovibrio frisius]|nr:hypothetical protein Thiofri_00072 [Thiorhodovibrio frisius]